MNEGDTSAAPAAWTLAWRQTLRDLRAGELRLLLVAVGYRAGGGAPILLPGEDPAVFAAGSVDPLPQALVLTSIVIGLGATMLLVAMVLRLHQRYGTLDVDRMDRLKG